MSLDQTLVDLEILGIPAQIEAARNDSYAYTDSAVLDALGTRNVKETVAAASLTNINILSPGASIGGVTMSTSVVKRVLLLGQTDPKTNGIWDWSTSASTLVRSSDASTWDELVGATVQVLGGLQQAKTFLCTIGSSGLIGTNDITFTLFTSPDVISTQSSFVSASGSDVQGKGTQGNPFATMTAAIARSGVQYPHVFNIEGQIHAGWDFADTNATVQVLDQSKRAGKTTISSPIRHKTGQSTHALVGLTLTAGLGATAPIQIEAGNTGGNRYERLSWLPSASPLTNIDLMSIDVASTGFLEFVGCDSSGAPLASIPLPDFAAARTIYVRGTFWRLAFRTTGANGSPNVTLVIDPDNAQGTVKIPISFKGILAYTSPFQGQIVGLITTQAALDALLANTTTTPGPVFYALSGFTPTQGAHLTGAVIGKQSAFSITENWIERTFATAGATLATATGVTYGKNGTAWGSVGGATGGGTNKAFYLADTVITDSYTIPMGSNAFTPGPVTTAAGAVVTISNGSVWTIV